MTNKITKVATVFLILGVLSICLPVRADDLQEISKNINSSPDQIAKGKTVFTANCQMCHGPEGKGDGPAGVAFNPKPRNFTAEKFKQGSSPAATFFTVSHGLGSMPSFATMPVADRLAVIHFILSLSPNLEKDTPETLAKIGLDPQGKPLANFAGEAPALPVEFIIERMATDGNVGSLKAADLAKSMADQKAYEQTAGKPVVIKPDLKRGQVIFTSCVPCHGNKGEGGRIAQAPPIAGQDLDYLTTQIKNFQTGVRGANPNDVNGLRMRPMSRMLQTPEDVVNVTSYINSLTPEKPEVTLEGGNPEKGKITFAVCAGCHGPDAKGMKATHAPSLANLSDWYILEQIHKFKSGFRGAEPRDTTGATMRGMAMSLPDDQAIKDVIAYIATLQK